MRPPSPTQQLTFRAEQVRAYDAEEWEARFGHLHFKTASWQFEVLKLVGGRGRFSYPFAIRILLEYLKGHPKGTGDVRHEDSLAKTQAIT